ncbi:amidohydrolase [Micromonospora sp. NBRC 110038]|uniref:amidohydrolase family protein n=1 Tax=Micromonospora sp. NBRC 110038 TaxID=1550034 RepID=UPI001E331B22|nr:amidohydrolase family protein [Micromonospora sp. NBRC 110038]
MIVDAHTHAWPRWPYRPPVPDDATRGGVEVLLHEMAAAGVDRAVVVAAEIDRNADNNDYVAAAVARHPGRLHHFADLDSRWSPRHHTAGAADRLAALADRYPLAGISHYLGPDNDGWLRSADARALFAAAERRGLLMGLAAGPAWHADLRALAATVPGLPILCNHLALVPPWPGGVADALARVLDPAAPANLIVKVSGLQYGAADPWDVPHRAALDVVRAYYETWGPRRLVWGSDHPASGAAMTYRQSLEAVRRHCDFIAPADLPLVLGGTLAGLLGDPEGVRA